MNIEKWYNNLLISLAEKSPLYDLLLFLLTPILSIMHLLIAAAIYSDQEFYREVDRMEKYLKQKQFFNNKE